MRYLIKNGSIIDPAGRVATIGNVLIEDGKVSQVFDMADLAINALPSGGDIEVINARGAVIAPGLIDLHAHLGEPGHEHKETIDTGARAAAHGGFTTVLANPDTTPAIDNAAVVQHVLARAARAPVRVEPVGAITLGHAGKQLTEMAELVEAGCVALGDGGRTITDSGLLRSALSYAAMVGVPVFTSCADPTLERNWAMHEGPVSTRLGLPGSPAAAETIIIARDLALAELTGAHLHICSVSTAAGVALIREAKARGVRVTASVTPHHLTLSDAWVLGSAAPPPPPPATPPKRRRKSEPGLGLPSWLDPRVLPPYHSATRVRPPLRSDADCDALVDGLRDGTIDAVASDHTPQSIVEQEREYRLVEPGISGLETALAVVLSLVHRGEMDLVQLVACLTEGPANVLDRSPATLRPGQRADLVVFDPDANWIVNPNEFASLGHNTPYAGQRLKGRVMLTLAGGRVAFRRGNFGASTGMLQQASRLEGILDD